MKHKILLLFFVVFVLCVSNTISAAPGYNANIKGKVIDVVTYAYNDQILFILDNQSSVPNNCADPVYFIISSDVPSSNKKFMVARLMTALTTGTTVNIGYDQEGGCSLNKIKVYRVG